jgi:hypothetical protein
MNRRVSKPSGGEYTILVDDNYHYMDETARYTRASFDTLEDAIRECKRIVDRSLEEMYEPGMAAGELLGKYKMFGEDPFIVSKRLPSTSVPFSAWKYAEERCEEICGGSGPPAEDAADG